MLRRLSLLLLVLASLLCANLASAKTLGAAETRVWAIDVVGAVLIGGAAEASARWQPEKPGAYYETASGNTLAAEGAGQVLGQGERLTLEILDGVRRAKAAELAGRSTIQAELIGSGGKVVEVPLDILRSPFKSAIDVSSSARQFGRWQSVFDATKAGETLPPIQVQPGGRGLTIFEVGFE